MRETDPVSRLKGIGPKTAASLAQLGIETVGDLLRHYPARYDSYAAPVPIREAEEGKTVVVAGTLVTAPQARGFGRSAAVTAVLGDDTGRVSAVWFHQPYLKNTLRRGDRWVMRGRLVRSRFGLSLEQPQLFHPEEYAGRENTLQPVYATTGSLS